MRDLADVLQHFKTQAESEVPQLCWSQNEIAFQIVMSSPEYEHVKAWVTLLSTQDIERLRVAMCGSTGLENIRQRYEQMVLLLDSIES